VVGTLHEPNAWTVGVVLATGAVLLARHPIAHLLGTEVSAATLAPTGISAPARTALTAPPLSLPLAAAPTHAPRDPFRALVTAGGAVSPASVSAAPSASCAGTAHRVVAGDSLWTLAARAVRSSDTDRVTLAWHRIYSANRSSVGADPGLLQLGMSLCIPRSL
jgi:pilus assembly protein FimV